jgi:predicted RNase H-like HicB family nuclease
MLCTFIAYVEKDMESGRYFGVVPNVAGAHTEAETLDEMREKLTEVLELCLGEMEAEDINALSGSKFAGAMQIEAHL